MFVNFLSRRPAPSSRLDNIADLTETRGRISISVPPRPINGDGSEIVGRPTVMSRKMCTYRRARFVRFIHCLKCICVYVVPQNLRLELKHDFFKHNNVES